MTKPEKQKRAITRADIIPISEYRKIRKGHRLKLIEVKRRRRMVIGPFMTLSFENYDTMWMQVHEMLLIEQGGNDQIDGELDAYNPLIPNGSELVATMMLEIEDEKRRQRVLPALGHIEDMITISFDGEVVKGLPDKDVDRTTEEGKTSSVHFLHFPFTPVHIEKFQAGASQVIIGCSHQNYRHMAVMADDVYASLSGDLA